MEELKNPQLQLAFEFVQSTALNIFLTGNTASANAIFSGGFWSTAEGVYLVKFNAAGTRQWGTYYPALEGVSVTADGAGNVFFGRRYVHGRQRYAFWI